MSGLLRRAAVALLVVVAVALREGLALTLSSSSSPARLRVSCRAPLRRREERRWGLLRASESDGDGAKDDDDEELDAAFQARVAELGGTTGVRARATASKLQRGVKDAVAEKGSSLKKMLDLDPKAGSFAKGSAMEELQLLDLGGWTTTVGLLAVVVLLAVVQSFRLDPSNYT